MQYQIDQMKYVTKHDKHLKRSGQATANTDYRKNERNDASYTCMP